MELYTQFERRVGSDELDRFREMCRRRAGGEPIAYIRGRKEFMSIELRVTPAVLVPRPETETLVEEGLRLLRGGGLEAPRVLDVGTGSGAILLALLHHHPPATGVGTDISESALEVARDNANRLRLAERAEFRVADLAAGVEERFDLVTANLPYVDPAWPDAVHPAVAASEPGQALFAADGGLELVKRLIDDLPRLLCPDGVALLEVDPRNAAAALAHARSAGSARLLPDLAGRDRVLVVEGLA